jgi:hypothetical protein
MRDINNQREVKVDNTEIYKLGDKVKKIDGKEVDKDEPYSLIMIILNEYNLSVIKNETGILH